MTNQETFDTVAKHLLTQMKKSRRVGETGICLYRGPDGTKCAAGCLIPDCDYDDSWEGTGVTYADGVSRVGTYFKEKGFNVELVKALQYVHDIHEVELWDYRLRSVAKDFKLKFNEAQYVL